MTSTATDAEAGARHNLPSRLTSFVGRERELAELERLVGTCRLLTLTGPGGCGKTRLALELATRLSPTYPDGVFVASLAPLAAPELVLSTIADTIGAREVAAEPRFDTITRHIGERNIILLLDNFEHLLPASPLIADLLAACPHLTVIVTSRELLRLQAEQVIPVPSLTLPDLAGSPPPDPDVVSIVSQSEAGRLFLERARNVQPGFQLDRTTAEAVAEICTRLDGLPLAIELAAARVRLLAPRAMVERMEHPLPLLTGGARDLPARQQTLRDTIAWSHDLLDETDRVTFRRLAVFVGGWTLEAAEAVCGADDVVTDPLETVASLVDKSLVRQTDGVNGEPRFTMLETIREFALERLAESGEEADLRRRHAEHFQRFAEEAWPHLQRDETAAWLDRLEAEYDNLRAALTWSTEAEGHDEVFARLAGDLWGFWRLRGYWSDARRWLDRALGRTAAPPIRFKILTGAGILAHLQNDLSRSEAMWSEAVALTRAHHDQTNLCLSLGWLGYVASELGNHERALTLCRESLDLARQLGEPNLLSHAHMNLGHAARNRGDDDEAVASWEACIRIDRAAGLARHRVPNCLQLLAIVATRRAEFDRATDLCREALDLFRQRGDPFGILSCFRRLGRIAQLKGDPAGVAALALEGLPITRQLGNRRNLRASLVSLSWMARVGGDPERSTRLL
ncbi:MAG TPA: tetratricopeptide repeat protein, partial [Chloroflexota bacterium]|nr:tetratricopeptide repeat protein [Chloroflexota bacterium]